MTKLVSAPPAPKVSDDAPADRLAAITAEIADLEARRPAILTRLADPADRAAEDELKRLDGLLRVRTRERTDLTGELARQQAAEQARQRGPHLAAARRIAHEQLPQVLARLEASGAEHATALTEAITLLHEFGAELAAANHPYAAHVRAPSLTEVAAGAEPRIELTLPTFSIVGRIAPAHLFGNRVLSRTAYSRLRDELRALVDGDPGGAS